MQNEANYDTLTAMPLDFTALTGQAVLAPLAGFTDPVFRHLCRVQGAAFVVTEMISAEGILRGCARTYELTAFEAEERPVVIQLFGSDPQRIAEAARRLQALEPDGFDLNFGCPTPKVVRRGEGAALLRDLSRVESVARAVVRAVCVPVTAKIRSGWSAREVVAVEAARRLEQAGVAAVTLHPRTGDQRFRGKADWSLIEAVKKAVGICVIGNGDVRTAEDALQMRQQTGCDLVMIGRGALGNPWIFRQIRELTENGRYADPSPSERLDMALRHLELCVQRYGRERGLRFVKRHLTFYLKGLREATALKDRLVRTDRPEEAITLLRSYRQRFAQWPRVS
ncbi:MAG: tRNA dihydrouridine synthase DusB [candidate division KSB1 bacterium]|nr:tRNA dihydrouridine synthase DusB [candidate division KSB1 bacterium]